MPPRKASSPGLAALVSFAGLLRRSVAGVAAIFAAVLASLAFAACRIKDHTPEPPLDVRIKGYSAAEAVLLVTGYTPAAHRAVAAAEIVDLAFMVAYPLFIAALLAVALDRLRASPRAHTALLMPLAAGAADAVENVLVLHMLFSGPTLGVAAAAAVATRIKWVLVAASVVATLGAGAAVAVAVVREGAKKKAKAR